MLGTTVQFEVDYVNALVTPLEEEYIAPNVVESEKVPRFAIIAKLIFMSERVISSSISLFLFDIIKVISVNIYN